jgi:hypothetical protein
MNADVLAYVGQFAADIDTRRTLGARPGRLQVQADRYGELQTWLYDRQRVQKELGRKGTYVARLVETKTCMCTMVLNDTIVQYTWLCRSSVWSTCFLPDSLPSSTCVTYGPYSESRFLLQNGRWVHDPR